VRKGFEVPDRIRFRGDIHHHNSAVDFDPERRKFKPSHRGLVPASQRAKLAQ
jgi:hypothetical protein